MSNYKILIYILIIAYISNQAKTLQINSRLISLTELLHLKHFSVNSNSEINKKSLTNLIKWSSDCGKFTKIKLSQSDIDADSMLLWDENNVNISKVNEAARNFMKGLIIFKDLSSLKQAAKSLKFLINQEIYLYEQASGELHETYEINRKTIFRMIGVFHMSKEKLVLNQGVDLM